MTDRKPHGRLLSIRQAAEDYGLSFWTLRTLVLNGHIPRVVFPGPEGRNLRRILIDRDDMERFIRQCKEGGV